MSYDHNQIEKKWQKRWMESGVFEAQDHAEKEKSYLLIEFPYPSGAGLHIGHPRSYTALDIIARKQRMEGKNVLYPIGWDAFGLPTENFAIKNHRKPQDVTKENTDTFRRQLQSLGFSFDWSREVNTTDPAYYKWTQWMFLQFYKAGLAYKAKVPINWCLSCKIGLANEEVVNGVCERCGGPVEKRNKEQWMIAITKYAQRLLDDLDTVDYLPKIKKQQADWIGRSEGAEVGFQLATPLIHPEADAEGSPEADASIGEGVIKVFTTRPDTLFGATYMVLAPEHPLVHQIVTADQRAAVEAYIDQASKKSDIERADAAKEKTGVFTGAYAINPVNDQRIPVWVADYVMMGYGTGAIMAVPAHDERDYAFATKFELPIIEVVKADDNSEGCFAGEGTAMNSDFLNGLLTEEAKKKITTWLEEKGLGKATVNYKLRDWVFSRQRYWGEPIPLVHCEACAKKKKTVMAFHGWEGTRDSDFFPYLKADLESKGYEFVVNDAPNTESPVIEDWMAFAEAQLEGRDTSAMTLVGHSMGTHLVMKLAEKYTFERIILVAPNAPLGDEYFKATYADELSDDELQVYAQFYREKHDIEKIKNHVRSITVLTSADDIWVTPQVVEYYRTSFGDKMRMLNLDGYGHFSTDAGVGHIPELERLFAPVTGWVSVPDDQLPVTLPDVEKYEPTDTGESPLSAIDEWVSTTCPQCGGPAKRETDTMPNWAGSSWYFLRYIDAHNDQTFADPEKIKYWMPVDLYNGGMEHTTLHLLYSRFWHKFLYDQGLVSAPEPYARRHSHGLILAEDGHKMSKSRGNVVNPDEIVEQYGADTLRVYEMFMGPFEEPVPWSMNGLIGVRRFLDKIVRLSDMIAAQEPDAVTRMLHKTIKKVTEDIEDMRFNTAVSQMMMFVNDAQSAGVITKDSFLKFMHVLCPFAPHLANELAEKLGGEGMLEQSAWPAYDSALIVDELVNIAVQVNGKLRGTVQAAPDAVQDVVEQLARADENVAKHLKGDVKKVIYVPGRLINFVM